MYDKSMCQRVHSLRTVEANNRGKSGIGATRPATHVRCTFAMRIVAMSSAKTSTVRNALARPSRIGLASTMS